MSVSDLFTDFVGLVSARDKNLSAECLLALEDAVIAAWSAGVSTMVIAAS